MSAPANASFLETLAPYMQYANQAKQVYDMVKPDGGLQKGDVSQLASTASSMGAFDKLPDDVRKALMSLVGGK